MGRRRRQEAGNPKRPFATGDPRRTADATTPRERAPRRDLPTAARAFLRGTWQVTTCAALTTAGSTLILILVLRELAFHLPSLPVAQAFAMTVIAIGVIIGLQWPRRIIQAHIARTDRVPPPSFQFAATFSAAAIVLVACLWTLTGGFALALEQYRGWVVGHFGLPAAVLQFLVVGPLLITLLLAAGLTGIALTTLHGWRKTVASHKAPFLALWRGITLGAICGAAFGAGPLSQTLAYVSGLLLLFGSGWLAVATRGPNQPTPTASVPAQPKTPTHSDTLRLASVGFLFTTLLRGVLPEQVLDFAPGRMLLFITLGVASAVVLRQSRPARPLAIGLMLLALVFSGLSDWTPASKLLLLLIGCAGVGMELRDLATRLPLRSPAAKLRFAGSSVNWGILAGGAAVVLLPTALGVTVAVFGIVATRMPHRTSLNHALRRGVWIGAAAVLLLIAVSVDAQDQENAPTAQAAHPIAPLFPDFPTITLSDDAWRADLQHRHASGMILQLDGQVDLRQSRDDAVRLVRRVTRALVAPECLVVLTNRESDFRALRAWAQQTPAPFASRFYEVQTASRTRDEHQYALVYAVDGTARIERVRAAARSSNVADLTLTPLMAPPVGSSAISH